MRKNKYSPEVKLQVCEAYLKGTYTMPEICQMFNILYDKYGWAPVYTWVRQYMANGTDAFLYKHKNKAYSKELKLTAVEEYIDGKGSILEICLKHGISDSKVLRKWISLYNSDIELKDYNPKQEVYMAESRRKTTIDERKDIVKYCIDHNRDYKGTASKYDISYSQVYNWVRKYDVDGTDGLMDKRGCHKADDEVDELEKLRRENKRLKRQLEEKDMTVELLKKVKEFERRRF